MRDIAQRRHPKDRLRKTKTVRPPAPLNSCLALQVGPDCVLKVVHVYTVTKKSPIQKSQEIRPPPVKRVHVAFLSLVPCQALVKWIKNMHNAKRRVFHCRLWPCKAHGSRFSKPGHYNLSCVLPCILLLLTQPNSELLGLRLLRPEKTIPRDGSRVKGPCHIFFAHRLTIVAKPWYHKTLRLDKEAVPIQARHTLPFEMSFKVGEAPHIEHVRQVLGLAGGAREHATSSASCVRIAAGCISAQSLCTIHLADVDLTWRSEQAKLANLS